MLALQDIAKIGAASVSGLELPRGRPSAFSSEEEGQAVIELAFCLPLLLLVVTGILSFGLTFNSYIQLTEATSVGARLLAVSRNQTLDPCAYAAAAVFKAAPLLNQTSLRFFFVINGDSYSGSSCPSSSYTTGAAGSMQQPQGSAQLRVTYPCSLAVFGMNYAPSCSLTASSAESIQ